MHACKQCGGSIGQAFRLLPVVLPRRSARSSSSSSPARAPSPARRCGSRATPASGHVRFSVWDESGVAEAAVSIDDEEAQRLAAFLGVRERLRRRSSGCAPRASAAISASASSRRSSTGRRNVTSSSTIRNGSISLDAAGAEPVADPLDELLRRRRARCDADRLDAVEPRLVDLGLVVDQVATDAAGPRDLDQAVRVRRVARADHEQQVDLGRASPSPPTAGWTSRNRCPPSSARGSPGSAGGATAMISPVSSTDSVVCVMYASRRVRRAARAPPRPRPPARARSSRAPRPSSRRPPRGRRGRSGRPCSPRRRSGAPGRAPSSRAGRSRRSLCPRPAESACTDGATPWAEKTTVAPSGTSSSSSTKTAPRPSRSRTTWMLWTICLRT